MHIDKYKRGDVYIDARGQEYDKPEAFIVEGLLGFCGCGMPDQCLRYINKCLSHINELRAYDHTDRTKWSVWYPAWVKRGDAFMGAGSCFTWYVLDERGLLEHGGNVPGWLTPLGEELLEDTTEILAGPEYDDQTGTQVA